MEEKHKNLLENTKLIMEKYEKEQEYKFNIFPVLRNEYDEVGLHSAFLSEILDPKGSHGKGETFLELFLSKIQSNFLIENIENTEVISECDISDGRVDILCKSPNAELVIENKLLADISGDQLERYLKYLKNRNEKYLLVLLTLKAKDFDEDDKYFSEWYKHENFKVISYENEIKNWLQECIKETALNPSLRESLNMYKELVLRITGQSSSEGMVGEMRDLLMKNEENLKAAFEIEKALKEVRVEVQKQFWEGLENKLKEKIKLESNKKPYFAEEFSDLCYLWQGKLFLWQYRLT